MKTGFSLSVILILIAICFELNGQDQQTPQIRPPEGRAMDQVRIMVRVRSYGDSIVVRWAPNHPVAWSVTNRFGYIVTRRYLDVDDEYKVEVLTPEPLKPWSLERMMDHFGPNDTIAAVAAETIHGEGFTPGEIDEHQQGFMESLIHEQEIQQTRFAFAMQAAEFSPEVAKAMALRFTDHDVKEGVLYDYLVTVVTPEDLLYIEGGSDLVRCGTPEPLYPPDEVDIRQSDYNRIELAWSRDRSSAYFIERSTDGGQTFNRVNRLPYYSTEPDPTWESDSPTIQFYGSVLDHYHIFSDTVTPGITYHYRLQGIDGFSDLTPFTEPVHITPIDLTPLTAPVILQASTYNDTMVKVSWGIDDDPDVAGFYIEKSDSHEGIFTRINDLMLPPNTTEFVDVHASETRGGFYRVVAIGHSGKQSMSSMARGFVEDFDPPSTPEGLNGIVYHDGIVELFWDHSPEDDVRGYRVAYANQVDHDFVVITPWPISDNYFRDTIPVRTLTRNIYYKVLAEDFSGNRSPYTEILKLTRPDIIPPVTPVAVDARQDAENVHIWWSPSPSKDLLIYRVFRKQEKEERWALVQEFDPAEVGDRIAFTDSPSPSPMPYLYGIEAIDQAGNTSGLSRVLSFRVRGNPVPDIPISLTAQYDEENRQVNLQWTCDSPFPYYVILLRSAGDAPLAPVTTLEASHNSYTDRRLNSGSSFSYAIRLQLEDGRQSQPSETIQVTIP